MSSRPWYLLNALLAHGEETDALPVRLTFYTVAPRDGDMVCAAKVAA